MNQLRELRKAQGLTQARLAEALSISPQHVQAIEADRRRPSPEVAERIRDFFGFTTTNMWEMLYGRTKPA